MSWKNIILRIALMLIGVATLAYVVGNAVESHFKANPLNHSERERR